MPINVKALAVRIATVWFFVTAFIGWMCRQSPITCSRKAFFGSIAVYIVCVIAGRIINGIVFEAIVSQETEKLAEKQDTDAN